MSKTHIIIINGAPRAGKDTTISLMRRTIVKEWSAVWNFSAYSTIDPVKEAFKMLGWNGEKDNKTRDMLASMKQWWIENSNGPIKFCYETINRKCQNNDFNIIVFQIREPDEIDKLIKLIDMLKLVYDIDYHTLYITNSAEDVFYSNAADRCTANYSYDNKITNNGTIDELESKVKTYISYIINEGYKEEN